MSIKEKTEQTFSEKFYEINDMNKIIEFIKKCKDKLILNKSGLKSQDVTSYTTEGKEPDLEVKCNGNEINYAYDFDRFKEIIINNINPSIKELSLPTSFLTDNISFLENLKSLSKLTISDGYFLTPEQLDFVEKHTSIKEIDFMTPYISNKDYENLVLIDKDGKLLGYNKDIILREIEKGEKSVLLDIVSPSSDKITVEAKQVTLADLDKMFNLIGEDLTKKNRRIEIKCNKQKYVFNIIDGIVNMDIEDPNMNIASDLNNFFSKKGIKTNGVYVKIVHGYADKDLEPLDKLNEEVEVRIRYNTGETSSYDDFKGLSETMKWYRQIIKDYPLSPVEKLTFAYDILKTLEYSETEDTRESRAPFKIVKTGHIVCVGYTAMLQEIFDELDENIKIGDFSLTCYDRDNKTVLGLHNRAIAIVEDEKYGIHGAYALDPTWDSYKENGQEKIDSEYTALDSYDYFMVPFKEYKNTFKHDSDINFFTGDISYLNSNLNDANIDKAITTIDRQNEQKEDELSYSRREPLLNYEIKEMFPEKSEKEIIESFKSNKIPNNIMMEIIRNVRLAEGYSKEQIDTEIEKVSRIYDKTHQEVDHLTGKML